MKRLPVVLILLILALSMTALPKLGHAVTDQVILKIEGMTWGAWPLIIKKALEGLDGVEKASINFRKKSGKVLFDPDKVSEKDIVDKVNQIGFRAKVMEK